MLLSKYIGFFEKEIE